MNTPRIKALIAAVGLTIAVAACGSGAGSSSSAPSPSSTATTVMPVSPTTGRDAGAAATITIHNFSFGAPVTVTAGATVTVHNSDSTTHSLSADDGSFDAGANVPAGQTHTFTAPTKPGRYAFHCNFHAEMHGTLIVTSKAA
ncbi:MAG TPA: cupredoxin domain-containing protein [Acidimicrobiia bacterium]|jgi:plastocyanin|nr:cupredoxin domain-containing protein [Acidimicrobiia bacterium]